MNESYVAITLDAGYERIYSCYLSRSPLTQDQTVTSRWRTFPTFPNVFSATSTAANLVKSITSLALSHCSTTRWHFLDIFRSLWCRHTQQISPSSYEQKCWPAVLESSEKKFVLCLDHALWEAMHMILYLSLMLCMHCFRIK